VLVSVVIPLYNQANFILQAVASVRAQTHRDLEIIVVDDGSDDGGSEILRQEFGADLVLIEQKNRGPSASINVGLRAATGSFIALLGGDDLCMPDRIEQQLVFAHETANDIVFSQPVLIGPDGQQLPDDTYPVFYSDMSAGRSIFNRLLLDGNFLCAPTALMRREVVGRIGYFHEGLIQLQDYEYWLRACVAGCRLGVSPQRAVAYRRHVGNLSSSNRHEATLAELPLVIRHIVELAPSEIMRDHFPHMFTVKVDHSEPLSRLERALFLMAHGHLEVRAEGMRQWMILCDDPFFHVEASRYGVNPFRLLYQLVEEQNDAWRLLELGKRKV
jgi:glycosyltransferase involved in cell wall biosynthesis